MALASFVISENNTMGVYEAATANLIPYKEHAEAAKATWRHEAFQWDGGIELSMNDFPTFAGRACAQLIGRNGVCKCDDTVGFFKGIAYVIKSDSPACRVGIGFLDMNILFQGAFGGLVQESMFTPGVAEKSGHYIPAYGRIKFQVDGKNDLSFIYAVNASVNALPEKINSPPEAQLYLRVEEWLQMHDGQCQMASKVPATEI